MAAGLVAVRLGPAPVWCGCLLAAVLGLGTAVALGRLETAAAVRRRRQLVADAPQVLELLAACLAAGLPVRAATASVVAVTSGPVAEDLGGVLAAIDVGVGDAEAWRTLRGHPVLGSAAVDLARSAESGSMLVETLAYHAREARRRRTAALEVSAKAVGVRSVLPLMTCFLPSFLLLGIVPTVASAVARALP